MADTNPSQNDPANQRKVAEEKRAQWEAITKKREEMIAAEKAKAEKRSEAKEEMTERQQADFQAGISAEKVRHDKQEDWRLGQHEKRREAEKKRKEIEEQKKLLEEEKKKHDAAEAQRKAYMDNVHKVAVAHKIRDKREAIEDEAERQKKAAADSAERQVHQLDDETVRSLHHIDSEHQKKLRLLHADSEHRKKSIADKEQPISERNRELLALEEEIQSKTFMINQETKRLKDEVIAHAGQKKQKIAREETAKENEAEQRKENFEKWLREG
jgi:hypothetical protein